MRLYGLCVCVRFVSRQSVNGFRMANTRCVGGCWGCWALNCGETRARASGRKKLPLFVQRCKCMHTGTHVTRGSRTYVHRDRERESTCMRICCCTLLYSSTIHRCSMQNTCCSGYGYDEHHIFVYALFVHAQRKQPPHAPGSYTTQDCMVLFFANALLVSDIHERHARAHARWRTLFSEPPERRDASYSNINTR